MHRAVLASSFVLLAALPVAANVPAARNAPPAISAADAAKIGAIEGGLLAAVVIAGRVPQKMTLRSRLAYYRVPAVGIAFFDADRVRWARAYGNATTGTLFQAGSISKPVSAVGIMRLVQDGRLALSGNVNNQLRGWKIPENPYTVNRPVTLFDLLSMTAGTNVHGFDGYEMGKAVPTLLQVLDGSPPANSPPVRVDAAPGTQYRYSGGGYEIAQLLAQEALREPFARYMRDTILVPLGMRDSTFEQPLPDALRPRAAIATDAQGKPYPGRWHVYPELTAAGLWSTPSDLAKFGIGVQHALEGKPGAVLSQGVTRTILTPVKDHYGLGFAVYSAGPTGRFGHDGANAGFQASLVMYRGGQGVAIMTDSDNGILLIGEITNAIAAAYGWPDYKPKAKRLYPLPSTALRRLEGTYRFADGSPPVRVELLKDTLYLAAANGRRVQLYPASATRFFELEQDVDVVFTLSAAGRSSKIEFVGPTGESVSASKAE
jgi:CubicO group peptidase (beta-lactamase class C family)